MRSVRKRKLIILILVLELLVLLCLCYLLFLPHSPEALLQRAQAKTEGFDNYAESLVATTEMTLSSEDVKGLKEIDEKVLNVPVEISSNADVKAYYAEDSGDGSDGNTHFFSHVKKTITYQVFDEEAEVYRESYTDEVGNVLYTLRSDGWHKEKPRTPQTLDPKDMLKLAESVMDKASFRSAGGQYRLLFNATDLDTSIVRPFVRDPETISIVSGEVIYGFNKRTMLLETIEGNNLVICSTSAIGTDEQAESESMLDVRIGFSKYGEINQELLQVPEDIVAEAKADNENDDSSKNYIVSIEGLEKENRQSYTVGEAGDIPAGKYIIKHRSGAGIVRGLSSKDATEIFTYTAGYDYYKIDNIESGKEVEINEGDKILLSGDKFAVVFEPVESTED